MKKNNERKNEIIFTRDSRNFYYGNSFGKQFFFGKHKNKKKENKFVLVLFSIFFSLCFLAKVRLKCKHKIEFR